MEMCQNCNFYKKPKCTINNTFKARKTEACDEFKINKNKKIQTKKKIIKNKSEEDIKNEILGEKIQGPKISKLNRSKKNKRK